jgi:tetratricopeptide (TPR) repeat protein
LRNAVLAWNDAQVSSSLQVAKALRLELKKTESDASSVLVQAHRRVAGATLSARAMSRLALGDLWLASLDAEAACDAAPELALAHVRLGEVYEACGGRDGAVRSFQRAAALAPTSIAISKRLEEARAAPAAATPRGGWGGDASPSRAHAGAGPSSAVGTFDVSLDAVDAAWEATGLKHIKASEWYDLRRKACPHGVTLSPADEVAGCALFDASLFSATPETRETRETKKSNRAALKNLRDVAAHAVPSEKYAEKELFAERAMSLYAKKRASGGALPEGSTWLDLAFEAVNIDALEPGEQLRICVCLGNIFAWCADFSGADELYSFALEIDDAEAAGGALAGWRPALLANRALCRLRLGQPADAAIDAEACLREAGPRWGVGLCRMGQVMCAMGAWAKAEQTFRAAHRRCGGAGAPRNARGPDFFSSWLELEVKIALANSAGMGLPAAREAGEKAVDAVRAARELTAVGELFDHMDAVVQLDALEPDADVPPIPGPTPRFMAAAAGLETADEFPDLDTVGDLPEVAPGLRPGVVNALGGDGRSLSETLGELDGARRAGASAAPSGDSVEKAAPTGGETKKRSRGEKGQEAESAAVAVAGLTVSDEEGDTPTAQKVKTRGCGAGCGDFFSWASGGLFGTPGGDAAPSDAEGEKSDAYDDGVAEELASSVKAAKHKTP